MRVILPKLEKMVLGDPPVSEPEPAKAVRKPKTPKPTAKAPEPAAVKATKVASGRKK